MLDNRLAGAAVFACAAVLVAVAFGASRERRPRRAVLLLVAAALGLRLFAASDHYLHEWDERFHAVVARNLLRHPLTPTLYDDPALGYDHREWFANHVWLHKPPLALWAIAASLGAFGVHELAVRLPSVVATSLAVALTFDIARRAAGRRAAFFAAFLHVVNGRVIELAAGKRPTDHVDSLLVVLVEAGIWLALRSAGAAAPRPALALALAAGAVTGLAILTKGLVALLVLVVWAAALAPRAFPRLLAGAAAAAAVAAPWHLYVRRAFPAEYAHEQAYELRHLFVPLEGHAQDALFHFRLVPLTFGEVGWLAIPFFLVHALRRRRPVDRALLAWIVAPFVVFSLAATRMPAYTMVAAPAVFVAIGWGAARLLRVRGGPGARRAAAAALVLVLALPVRFAVERARPFSRDTRRRDWADGLRAAGRELRAPCVLFGTPRAVEAMFYTPCVAYPFVPAEEDQEALRRRGYALRDASWAR